MKTKFKAGMCIMFLIIAIVLSSSLTYAVESCSGNICQDTVRVALAGEQVIYEYTQYVTPNGEFKIRFKGGNYNDIRYVAYAVSGLPQFVAGDIVITPRPDTGGDTGWEALPLQEISTPPTSIKQYIDSIGDKKIDFVISLRMDNIPEGNYDFEIILIQYGESVRLSQSTFYISNTAPSNNDESEIPVTPCYDNVDNDLDYVRDCKDNDCINQPGNGEGDLCEAVETVCNDEFDNDADGLTDCLDAVDCNGRPGNPLDPAENCEIPESTCDDEFDNDADGLMDCGGDYDCYGNPACPEFENLDALGSFQDAQCFDSIDNDLDTLFDCADDPDCIGITNPNIPEEDIEQTCREFEFYMDVVEEDYQLCNTGFDENGNALIDCQDPSCKRMFGDCGPCPDVEDMTYDSCADGLDNDLDGSMDCFDTTADCGDELGSITNAAWCKAVENTAQTCSDNIDNDGEGGIDCQDSQCSGKGPAGKKCQHMKEITCDDAFDNDGNGLTDCLDPECSNDPSCLGAKNTVTSCITVPQYDSPKNLAFNNPTVSAKQYQNVRAGSQHQIIISGTGIYKTATIIIGEGGAPEKAYPYDGLSCTVSDQTLWGVTIAEDVIQIQAKPAQIPAEGLNGFDVTLTCNALFSQNIKQYPIYFSGLKKVGAVEIAETGEQMFSTASYEGNAPLMTGIEVEGIGADGKVNIEAGDSVRFMALAQDGSGICGCGFDIDGSTPTTDGNCIASKQFDDDTIIPVSATATDGADNTALPVQRNNIEINIGPAVTNDLTLDKTKPFYKTEETGIMLNADFTTATSGNFPLLSECQVTIRDSLGTILTDTTTISKISTDGNDYTLTCEGTIPVPTLGDGLYTAEVTVTDNEGDSITTSKKPFFVCDVVDKNLGDDSPCRFADFDQDGASEGIFTNMYGGSLPCDNCPDYNPEQLDLDATGFGDICEDYFREGDVTGIVTCEGVPVEVAQVCYYIASLDSYICAETDVNGAYNLYGVPMSTQELTASKTGSKSDWESIYVKPRETVTLDFTNVCPITTDCNPDCTVVGTETQVNPRCNPECNGVNGCRIFSNEYVSCGYTSRGARIDYHDEDKDYYVVCCSGEPIEILPEEKVESKLKVDAENIVKTTRIVRYKGRIVKMVVVTWE